MEGSFHQNAHNTIFIEYWLNNLKTKTIAASQSLNRTKDHDCPLKASSTSTDSFVVNLELTVFITRCVVAIIPLVFCDISMLKRSHSMEFDTNVFKTPHTEPTEPLSSSIETEEREHSRKKLCNSHEQPGFEQFAEDREGSPDNRNLPVSDAFKRASHADNTHVTQSRSIFSHRDSFVYGNPKEVIKTIEKPVVPDVPAEMRTFDHVASNVLDLSCKSARSEEEKPHMPNLNLNYNRRNFAGDTPVVRSHLLEMKKPSVPEQLQIAKIQQQQRKTIQQQQKMLTQMRRSLDPSGKSTSGNRSHHHSNNSDISQGSHKNIKYYGNSTPSHDVPDNQRMKEEVPAVPPLSGGAGGAGAHFPPPYPGPYFNPNPNHKLLPDGHPILPLLDPVYFSALYNAHGFMPPSSPSIAAAFIGTLQDALPKMPNVFPSTSSNNPLLPQKSSENPN